MPFAEDSGPHSPVLGNSPKSETSSLDSGEVTCLQPPESPHEGLPIPQALAKSHEYHQLLQSLPELAPRRGSAAKLHRVISETSTKPEKPSLLHPKNWLSKQRKKSAVASLYSIEYSVFRPIPQMGVIQDAADFQLHFAAVLLREGLSYADGEMPENYLSIADFETLALAIVHDVEHDLDLKPMRISQGSSGSYFIVGKRIGEESPAAAYSYEIFKKGIFKPKDEEPYGPLSPKWSKWLHRTFFPCFFGRSCLIPNLGYISEAAACILDRQLLSFIVPYTDIIYLRSNQFYRSFWDRTRSRLTWKIGSYQCFLNGYVEAHTFLRFNPIPPSLDNLPDDTFQFVPKDSPTPPSFYWSAELITQFQDELEKLVILDYIMRNTDRGADNWMIKIEWYEKETLGNMVRMHARLKIGAIDSGLAFPWKHPDEWRSFPFGWLFLPYSIIGRPFSMKTRQHYLPLLTSKYWWEQTTMKLKAVFEKDTDFKERMWHKQIAVIKGQAFNVVEVLKLQHAGPLELTRRENLLIWDDLMNVPETINNNSMSQAMESSIYDLPSWVTHDKSQQFHDTEITPLLKSKASQKSKKDRNPDTERDDAAPRQMSGFDYNMCFHGDHEHLEGAGTNTRIVVIERLEKVYSKLPVFTWC